MLYSNRRFSVMLNYIIDNNSELSTVTDDLFKFLKVYDSIYAHTIEVICIDGSEQCRMVIDKEHIEFTEAGDSITHFGEQLAGFLSCKKETADHIIEKAIIEWKSNKGFVNIGILKH